MFLLVKFTSRKPRDTLSIVHRPRPSFMFPDPSERCTGACWYRCWYVYRCWSLFFPFLYRPRPSSILSIVLSDIYRSLYIVVYLLFVSSKTFFNTLAFSFCWSMQERAIMNVSTGEQSGSKNKNIGTLWSINCSEYSFDVWLDTHFHKT